jgi:dTDP-4-dehydrorhamnose 3,5-epimerase-like enzyme
MDNPIIIQGEVHDDDRGSLQYFNDLDMTHIRRMYSIEIPNTTIVRAWQGHKLESKWFYVSAGKFKIVLVKPDNWVRPSMNLNVDEFILEAKNNQVLFVPSGYVNGFKALSSDSKLIVFSNTTLQESIDDNYRFDKALWYKWG